MNSETIIFNCLLESTVIYNLYRKIGLILINDRDIANEGHQGKALKNTIQLLCELGFIQNENNQYKKLQTYLSYESFIKVLLIRLKKTYFETIRSIINCEKHYDEIKNSYYFFTNEVPLKYMGLIMLLEQAGDFFRENNRFYFSNIDSFASFFEKKRQKLSVDELNDILQHEAELGEEAEQYALKYEKRKLIEAGINHDPQLISQIDVSAGYDIVSYKNNNDLPNKFIEVKSCDNSLCFHISRNEIEKAKEKREAYYLYLYNRTRREIVEIQNPYFTIFHNNSDWFYEADSFSISKISM